eukprot:COSAG06_NODE_258_length_18940_cov_15.039648_3_plen_89_part_00
MSAGEYAYLGYGWQGCQCLPTDKYDHCLPFNMTYEFPELLERDYGAQAQKGVFLFVCAVFFRKVLLLRKTSSFVKTGSGRSSHITRKF